MATILCVDNDPLTLQAVSAQLAQEDLDYRLALATTVPEAIAEVEAILDADSEVPLIIANQALTDSAWLAALYGQFPQALLLLTTVAAGPGLAGPTEALIPQGQLYRCMSEPWRGADLRLTIAEALRRCRYERQLAQMQTDLAMAQRRIAQLSAMPRRAEPSGSLGHPQAVLALQASEAQKRAILSAVPDIMTVLTAQGQYVDFSINQFAGELVPFDFSRIVGAYVTELFPPEVAQRWLVAIERTLTTGVAQRFEQQLHFGDRLQEEEVRIVPYQHDLVLAMVRDITDRKQAELELRRNRELREAIFNESTDALFLVDAQTHLIVDCNDRAVALFEAETKARLIGTCGSALQRHPFTEAEVAEVLQTMAEKGFWSTEVEYVSIKGQRFWGSLAAKSIVVAGTAMQLVRVTDITQRRHIEAQIRDREQQLQLTLAFTGVGAWQWCPATGDYQWNGQMQELLEIPPGLGNMYQLWRDRIHPEDVERVETALQTALAQGLPFAQEYRYCLRDGQVGWRWLKGQGVYTPAGELEYVLGVVQDITDRRQIEAALQASEQNRKLALELTHTGSWEFDPASGAVLWSESHYRLLGIAPGEQPITYDTWRQAVHPDDRAGAEAAFALALAHQTPLDMEYRVVLPSGDIRWMLTRGQGVYDEDGQPLKMLGVMVDISDRKQVELALSLSQDRYRRATQAAKTGVWEVNLKTKTGYIDPSKKTLAGYTDDEISNQIDQWDRLIYPDDRDHVDATIQAYLNGETPEFTVEYRIVHRDGAPRWMLGRGQLRRDEQGQPEVFFGTTTDITQRKRAELALQQLNNELEQRVQQRTQDLQKLAAIVENSTDLIGVASLSGEAIYLNRAGQQLLGIAPGDLVGKPITTFLSPATVLQFEQETLPTLLRRGYWRGESSFQHQQTGEDLAFEQVTFLIHDPKTSAPLCMATICRDIRQRKRSEAERKQAETALQASEERFRGTFEQAALGIVEASLDGRIVQVNQKFCDLVGYSAAELLSKTYLELTHPDDLVKDNAGVSRLLSGEISSFTLEKRYLRRDQTPVWVNLAVSLVRDGLGYPHYLLGVVNDISDRKQAEESLKTLNQELEQRVRDRTQALQQAMEAAQAASRAKSAFLANMSHELRTPLNAILGFAQLMARDAALSRNHHQSLETINRSGEHLLALINDILEMAKIEAGQVSFKPVCFDLDALLHTLEDLFYLRARGQGLEFVVDRHPALPRYLSSDEPKLRQVLVNLIGNAVKFTPRGQISLRVAPAASFHQPPAIGTTLAIAFEVSDTGIGIPAKNLDTLFEPFVQIDQSTKAQEGTGLGLSISREFVQLLGGRLAVKSQLGRGSTFSFTLSMPVVDSAEDAEPLLPSAPIVGLAPGQSSPRLLVVDDDDTQRQLLTQLLSSVGFKLCEARDGQEAIALWERWRPQLVWLDLRMPTMGGYETVQQIRSRERAANRPPTKIIALTANAFEEDRAQALALGCDDFVRKPFQFSQVLAKLMEHLNVRYTYGPEPEATVEPLTQADAIAALHTLAPPLLSQFYQATLHLDSESLAQLIAQLAPHHPPLADLLGLHLDNFAFDTIHDLLRQAIDR